MTLRKCVSFSTHGSSTPLVVDGQATLGTPDVANLYAVATSDGFTNASCVEATGTQWVRLFVEWNYFAPNPPAAPGLLQRQAWGFPDAAGTSNRSSVALCYQELATNIAAARAAGAKVILTSKFFPQWVSGPDAESDSEPIVCDLNNVMPPDDALAFYTGSSTPPSGNADFIASDYAFHFWIVNLINLYHPSNPNRPAIAAGQYIDALEICNEPNYYSPAGTTGFDAPVSGAGAALAASTALMMTTAQKVATQLNGAYAGHYDAIGQPEAFTSLALLGPAISDHICPTVVSPFGPGGPDQLTGLDFVAAVISELQQADFDFGDTNFGWSHHDYGDIEALGIRFAALLDEYWTIGRRHGRIDTARVRRTSDALGTIFAPRFLGSGGQAVRALLAGAGWAGWADDVAPTVFMTEGGCRINKMPGERSPERRSGRADGRGAAPAVLVSSDGSSADPDMDFATGQIPAEFQRELQRVAVAGAAHTLSLPGERAGAGIGMLTNFLFFDTARISQFASGLLDEYGPYQTPAQANVPLEMYARPAFRNWSLFGF